MIGSKMTIFVRCRELAWVKIRTQHNIYRVLQTLRYKKRKQDRARYLQL